MFSGSLFPLHDAPDYDSFGRIERWLGKTENADVAAQVKLALGLNKDEPWSDKDSRVYRKVVYRYIEETSEF